MKQELKRLIRQISQHGIVQEQVLEALGRVPREQFIPHLLRPLAFEDRPLPIGWDQTISQPFTVAFMAQLLHVNPGNRILEIGCGSGYNAAVLQELTGPEGVVVSIERIPELADYAASRLALTGYKQVQILLGDGKEGCTDKAPFDRIIVTAQGPEIPPALINQLVPGGVLVMPVNQGSAADMVRLVKGMEGETELSRHGAFSFVPLV